MQSITEKEGQLFLRTYRRLPVEIDRADGMYIYAKNGTRYLDFLGGIAVNAAGHSHPAINQAITKQLNRYTHVSNFFYQDAQVEFVEKLTRMSRYDRAFLSNSGTEATDGALKLVRLWGSIRSRSQVLAFTGSFHGRSLGALSLMDKPRYKEGMGPFLPGTEVLPFNDYETLTENVDSSTAAVFIEFLQGEGGVRWASPEFVERLSELKETYGFLIVADEVQAGCGRTGKFFSFEHFGLQPDVVTMAKVLGGGLPLGAILTTEELADVWDYGRHGTTFGGNALACAAGSKLLDLLENGLMEQASHSGAYLMDQLNELTSRFPSRIREVRGAGAMVGVEVNEPAGPIVQELLDHQIIANATNQNVLRLLPPHIFEESHVATLVEVLQEILGQ